MPDFPAESSQVVRAIQTKFRRPNVPPTVLTVPAVSVCPRLFPLRHHHDLHLRRIKGRLQLLALRRIRWSSAIPSDYRSLKRIDRNDDVRPGLDSAWTYCMSSTTTEQRAKDQ